MQLECSGCLKSEQRSPKTRGSAAANTRRRSSSPSPAIYMWSNHEPCALAGWSRSYWALHPLHGNLTARKEHCFIAPKWHLLHFWCNSYVTVQLSPEMWALLCQSHGTCIPSCISEHGSEPINHQVGHLSPDCPCSTAWSFLQLNCFLEEGSKGKSLCRDKPHKPLLSCLFL